MEVPLAGSLVVVPGGFLDAGENDAVVCVLRLFLRPHVPVAIFGFWIRSRVEKPRMFVGGMVDDEVDDHADAALLAAVRELNEVAESSVAGIDVVIVGDVVTVVAKWRRLKGHQPDGGD